MENIMDKMQKKNYSTEAVRLLDKGYSPVAIAPGMKSPIHKNWTTLKCVEVVKNWPPEHGVGLRCGDNNLVGMDIDIYDLDMVNNIVDFLKFFLGDIITRVGQAPKVLVPLSCSEINKKLVSNRYLIPNTDKVNAIEILSTGQQFIVHGIHPDTQLPYTLSGELPSIADLPVVNLNVVKALFTEFDRLAEKAGWQPIVPSKNKKTGENRIQTSEEYHYNSAKNITDILNHYEWKYFKGNQWTRPGKLSGVSGTVTENTFYPFTSSTVLEANMSHRPYDIVLAYSFHDDTDEMGKYVNEVIRQRAEEVFGSKPLPMIVTPSVMSDTPLPALSPNGKFEIVMAAELVANARPTDWLIKDILAADSLSELFGAPGCYKSFMALHWALCIASGSLWWGHAVRQAPVIMIIGEGHNGYAKRIAAWCNKYNLDISKIPLGVSKVPMQMLDDNSAQAVAEAVEQFSKTHGKVGMVCIDTVARNFGPGDENSTVDMTKFVANLDTYIGTGINKLLVHHTGHANTERARGSSVLLGAVDSEYRLSKDKDIVTLTNTKMKDDPEFLPMNFKPDPVVLSGNFGDMESSIVLVSTDEKPIVKLTEQMRDALSLLDILCHEDGRCYKADWMESCRLENVYAKSSFYSAINTMVEKEVIKIKDNCVQRF